MVRKDEVWINFQKKDIRVQKKKEEEKFWTRLRNAEGRGYLCSSATGIIRS